jgi:hypothetical protein
MAVGGGLEPNLCRGEREREFTRKLFVSINHAPHVSSFIRKIQNHPKQLDR